MTLHQAEKKKNGGTVLHPVPLEVAAVDVADRHPHDQSALIDPIQKKAFDLPIKTLLEKAAGSHLKGLLPHQERLKGHAGPDQEHPKNLQRNPDLGHDRRTVLTKNPRKANTERLLAFIYKNHAGIVFCASDLSCKSVWETFPLSPSSLFEAHVHWNKNSVLKGNLLGVLKCLLGTSIDVDDNAVIRTVLHQDENLSYFLSWFLDPLKLT